jgi:hypothetical protein
MFFPAGYSTIKKVVINKIKNAEERALYIYQLEKKIKK